MADVSAPIQKQLGLRERKKAKLRMAIQQQAMRLFKEQGYENTTIEQIAEAVEISPSTFFRYFPTKDDVILYDDLDPIIFAAFESQPAELTPIQAMLNSILQVFASLSETELQQIWERGQLMLSNSNLRMRMMEQLESAMQSSAHLIAKRIGASSDDIRVTAYSGAVIGVVLAVVLNYVNNPEKDIKELLQSSLTFLESEMKLTSS